MILTRKRMFSRESVTKRAGFPPLLLAGLLFALPETVWANLAVFSVSDIQRTGNLVPLRKTQIELVSESFTAKLDSETAQVRIDYEFLNTAGDDTVTVGFPVDLMPPPSERTSYHLNSSNDGLQDLTIVDGRATLPIERTVEETLASDKRPTHLKDAAITRRWSIATLHFKEHEKKSLRVTYVVRCMGVDEGFEKEIPRKMSTRTFLYTFRTATGWGAGRIRKLDVAVDTTYLRQNRFPILEMKPKLKETGEGTFHSEFQNAQLSTVPDLVINYDPKPALFHSYAEENLLKRSNWQLGLCGSGKLRGETLTDGNSQTAWTPDSSNANPCIEIKPQHDSYIIAIAVLNGDQRSASGYARSARIKKLRVEYDLFLVEGRKHEIFEQTLPDAKFDDRVSRFPTALAHFLDLPSGPEGILENVKLTVLEQYPGIENASLAISEIYVLGVNGRK